MSLPAGKFTAKVKKGKECKSEQWLSKEGETREELVTRMKNAGEIIDNFEIIDPFIESKGSLVPDSDLLRDLMTLYYATETKAVDDKYLTELKEKIKKRIK